MVLTVSEAWNSLLTLEPSIADTCFLSVCLRELRRSISDNHLRCTLFTPVFFFRLSLQVTVKISDVGFFNFQRG